MGSFPDTDIIIDPKPLSETSHHFFATFSIKTNDES